MTVRVCDAPADERQHWRIEVTGDEPESIRIAAKVLTDAVQQGRRPPPGRATIKAWLATERAQAKRDNGEPTDRMRKALFALARQLRLDRDDRLSLAEVVLERDVTSWSELTYDDARRLLDVMTGYVYVRHLRLEKAGR